MIDRFSLPPTAVECVLGDFIDVAALDTLLDNREVLTRAKRELEGVLSLLRRREELTVATIMNLANSARQTFLEPELVGRRYKLGSQLSNPSSDGSLVRMGDAERLRDMCLSLFGECEALQDVLRSEIHTSHHNYVFTWRGSQS